MKSDKGVTMGSLVIYITIFFAISSIIAVITTYYYQNIMDLDSSAVSAVEYDKLNVYLLKEVKKSGNDILEIERIGENIYEEGYARSVTFSSGNSYYVAGNNIYMNQIKICENVTFLEFEVVMQNNEKILKVMVQFGDDILETDYVLALEKDYEITKNQDSEFSSNNNLQTCTVSFFDENGRLLDIITVSKGSSVTYYGELVKPADQYYTYTHDSWTTVAGDSSTKVNLSNITSNMNVYALYIKTPITYTVKFYDENGTTLLYTATVNSGETAVYGSAIPTKTGYTFSSWVTSAGGSIVASLENITKNTNVYASYT